MPDILYTALILILFCFVALWGVKRGHMGNQRQALASLNGLRGLFALDVVLGHAVQYHFDTRLHVLSSFMLVSVGFFFFISAFGMSSSFMKKKGYPDNMFVIRKCGYLFAIAVLIYLINSVIGFVFKSPFWQFDSYKAYIIGFPGRTNWYIWQLMAFYVLFYLVYRFVPKYRCLLVTGLFFIGITVGYICGIQERYYISSMSFPFGLFMGEYYDKIAGFLQGKRLTAEINTEASKKYDDKNVNKNSLKSYDNNVGAKKESLQKEHLIIAIRGYLFTAILIIFGMGYVFMSDNIFGACYMKNAMCIGIICLLIQLLGFVKLNNPILSFLTAHATEIYVGQFVLIDSTMTLDYRIRIPVVVVGVLIMATLLHPIFVWLKKVFS